MSREQEAVEKLYRQAGNGNFAGDVFKRGWNDGLKAALVALGLETKESAEARFQKVDREREEKSLAALDRYNAERAEGAE